MPNFNRTTELAGIAEYVQLEFRCLDNPLSSDASYINSINAAMASDDRYIVARPARAIVRGNQTLGFGYGIAEAVIRTTGLANNVRYDDLLSGVDSPALGCSLIDWNYVTDSNDSQLADIPALINSGAAAGGMGASGAKPSPVALALAADPVAKAAAAVNPLPDANKTANNALNTIQIVAVVAGVLAVAYVYHSVKVA